MPCWLEPAQRWPFPSPLSGSEGRTMLSLWSGAKTQKFCCGVLGWKTKATSEILSIQSILFLCVFSNAPQSLAILHMNDIYDRYFKLTQAFCTRDTCALISFKTENGGYRPISKHLKYIPGYKLEFVRDVHRVLLVEGRGKTRNFAGRSKHRGLGVGGGAGVAAPWISHWPHTLLSLSCLCIRQWELG